MLSKLLINYEETASVILFCIGFSTMLLNKNLIKKIIGMDIMDTAVYLFLASQGYIKGPCRLWSMAFNPSRRISTRFRPVWC